MTASDAPAIRSPAGRPRLVAAWTIFATIAIGSLTGCLGGDRSATRGEATPSPNAVLRGYASGAPGYVLRADEGFKVTFPAQPSRTPGDLGTRQKPVPVVSYSVGLEGQAFLANFGDWGDTALPVDQTLRAAARQIAKQQSGQVETSRRMRVQGFPALRYLVMKKDGFIRGVVVIDRSRVYHLIVGGPKRDMLGYQRFVDSFTIL